MVRFSRQTFVDPDLLLSSNDILEQAFTESTLSKFQNDNVKALEFLASLKIIQNENYCAFCGERMSLVSKKGKQASLVWSCVRPCRRTETVV